MLFLLFNGQSQAFSSDVPIVNAFDLPLNDLTAIPVYLLTGNLLVI